IHTDVVNLSERGLNLTSSQEILGPIVPIKLSFPEGDLKLNIKGRLIWKEQLPEGNFSYGVEFIELNEDTQRQLRKELIRIKVFSLLNEIKEEKLKEIATNFFLKDLLEYIERILKIISRISKEKEYNYQIEKELEELNNEIVLKGHSLEESLKDKKIIQKVKENFRELIGTWAYRSIIMKRAFEKPRGYPGDYKMLEIIYDNKFISKNIIGLYFDSYFLRNPYAIAVKIRKDLLREILQNFLTKTELQKINILNIACGSCREIKELLPNLTTNSSIRFTCLDWDEEALSFSKSVLLPLAGKNIEFNFIKEDVMNLIKDEKIIQTLGRQNLIYSIGLIDYLPDRVLKRLVYILYQLLEKEGKLILTHKNKEKTFPPLPPDWFCDWKFVPRNKEEVMRLFYNCGIARSSILIDPDEFDYIYYFTVTKD
ncbi:MAG: PilZ domain-containing protein, partial [Candidatus Omnitrophica bacterium]|nr:PilZ domain-containing protein [Candidatus Omnitrophota bacterium]